MSLPANNWELDFYSRPLLDENGKKRWEVLICTSDASFQWQSFCPADSVNSIWLKTALSDALAAAADAKSPPPKRLRCWRSSMRTMVQRAAEGVALEMVPSRRCYALVEWLQEREASIYPKMEGYLSGPLAPPS